MSDIVYLDICCFKRPFDYSKERHDLFADLTLRELLESIERKSRETPQP